MPPWRLTLTTFPKSFEVLSDFGNILTVQTLSDSNDLIFGPLRGIRGPMKHNNQSRSGNDGMADEVHRTVPRSGMPVYIMAVLGVWGCFVHVDLIMGRKAIPRVDCAEGLTAC